ncbi:cation transporter [Mongoliitalea daihaiensis]|uniref:cation transporter n=1 Tax=Mongoliitalea daihaiensis TaxID=2782006 RepID=UPI001F22472F|nr:cation transporter [Mongoliitalea daihaiensis]UJP65685.1 cation transporter [Mongoliitalea daihaiensis]
MYKATFLISQMDCPSEETMIRMKLSSISSIQQLIFDIPNRKLEVYYIADFELIEKQLQTLNLGSTWVETIEVSATSIPQVPQERKLLWIVLGINFGFFVIESVAGVLAKSMGLIADSLDMLADAIVYGLALMAVGKALKTKQNVAKIAGIFQILLAIIGFSEVIRRFSGMENTPDFLWMIVVSFFALVANAYCLYLLQKSKSTEAHMQASMIFTSNDIIINTGVIIAGLAVLWSGSAVPDLIVGGIVFLLVMQGAVRILRL